MANHLDEGLVSESAAVLTNASPLRPGVYALSGEAVWTPPDEPGAFVFPRNLMSDPGLAESAKQVFSGNGLVEALDGAGNHVVMAPVEIEDGCVGLVLGASEDRRGGPARVTDPAPALRAYCQLFGEVLSARRAADDLTEELAGRYEELSLVYALTAAFDISKRQDEALDSILEAVTDTLAADLLVLRVPVLGFDRVFPQDQATGLASGRLADVVASRAAGEGESIAANFIQEDEHFAGVAGDFAHVAAVPLDVDGDPGALVIMRARHDARFYMGDIKLLEEVGRQISIFMTNHKIAAARQQLFDATVFGLARLAESRDPETGEHLERVSAYCRLLADELRARGKHPEEIDDEFIDNICRCSPLHDIGKVGIPDVILNKPGKLTPEEFEIMKTHAPIGGDTLRDIEERLHWGQSTFLTIGRQIAYSHHEKWNGAGYPAGLAATDIPLAARIMALADVYDALTSKRCYKSAFPPEKAHSIIVEEKGRHFDPDMVEAFLAVEGDFIKVMLEEQGA